MTFNTDVLYKHIDRVKDQKWNKKYRTIKTKSTESER